MELNSCSEQRRSVQKVFEELKLALTSNPVLKLYCAGAEIELHTDVLRYEILGAILLQRDADDGAMHPICYASWKTMPLEERYTSYELEILAVIKALKKLRVYFLGIPVKIATDCKTFALTMKKDTHLRVSHWALLIEEFDYIIEHRPGKFMCYFMCKSDALIFSTARLILLFMLPLAEKKCLKIFFKT